VDLSIIVVNWNSATLLEECLNSIARWLTGVSYEAIVVDNNSSRQDVEILKSELETKFTWARFIYNSKNIGFAKANNLALQYAKGKYILLLNPDTCFINERFINLLSFLEQPRIGMVGCKLLNSDRSIQLSCFYFPTPRRALATSLLLHKLMPLKLRRRLAYSAADHNRKQSPDWVMGAFMLLPRRVMEQIGGFDEEIFMYGEDMDLCYKVRSLGLDIIYSPEFELIHYGGCSGRQAWSDAKKEIMVYQAIFYFYRKHLGKGNLQFVRACYIIGTLLRLTLHGLSCLQPGGLKKGVHEMRTQYAVLLALLNPELEDNFRDS
jgi:GT2 family glycosyltransferase